ncbi:hypothetical protein HPB49_000982 [Dermacentor silvarum]|uniref:Uncharacterized protein n=1 Tax=Dermacentor silvarum TaxID=543639 RepID=A0ACB8D9E5_DERSI|nr:hypothetical protein HPB49_000982 [Dermacentor silvarum]
MSENLPTIITDGSSTACHVIASAAYAEHSWGSRFDRHKTVLANFYNNGTKPCKARMLNAEALQQALKSCDKTLVELSMPNIELESSVSLRQMLKRAGLAALFDPEKADLSGLLKESGEPLMEFVHKVKLKANKVGHEGEHHGVTVINESGEHPGWPIEFHVNHPFVFVLYEPGNNKTLFIGRVVELIW